MADPEIINHKRHVMPLINLNGPHPSTVAILPMRLSIVYDLFDLKTRALKTMNELILR